MSNPKVSIIVPVYKAESYLHRCVDSLLAQTFTEFEILLIDDGSPDNSGLICDEYASKDSRVRVFHKENGGVSSARNLGLDKANGEYILFIDSDDEISKDTLSSNAQFMSMNIKPDLIEYPAIYNYSSAHEKVKNLIYSITEGLQKSYSYLYNCNRYEVWSFFIRKSIISDKRFNENIKIGEDILFLYSIIDNVNIIISSPCGCYKYYFNENSAMNSLDIIEKENKDCLLLSEMLKLTTNKQYLLVNFTIVYYRKLYKGTIQTIKLKKTLKEIISKTHLINIFKSNLSFKSKLLCIYIKTIYRVDTI